MTETQEKVIKAIRNGAKTRKQIEEKSGLSFAQVHNSLKRLRKWGDIETDYRGKYSMRKK